MKIYFIIFLFFCSWVQAQDQLIIEEESLGVNVRNSKGKPIKPLKSVSFKKKKDKFVAKKYTNYDKVNKFYKKQTLPISFIKDFLNPTSPITLKTLGISVQELKYEIYRKNHNILTITKDFLTEDFEFKFDTLKFCLNNRFFEYGSFICSGKELRIYYNNNNIFTYNPDYEFTIKNLESYFRAYILLKNTELDGYIYVFSKHLVLNWIIIYLKNIQCEDYYASLFMKENPEYNTSYFKRTKKGWNFEEYLKKINSSKN